MHTERFACFGRDARHGGNVAHVITGASADPQWRQQRARAEGVAATVFVDPATKPDHVFVLDYYYPHKRSPLCLHASLAACGWFARQHPGVTAFRFLTAWQGQPVDVRIGDGRVFLSVRPQPTGTPALSVALAARLLDVTPDLLAGPGGVASVGSPKWLVPLVSVPQLQALQPDLAAIADWSDAHGVNGIFAYALTPEGVLHGRNFNHPAPASEDAATGVAAGALAVHLARDIELLQGDRTGQPCTLEARHADGAIEVGGRVRHLD